MYIIWKCDLVVPFHIYFHFEPPPPLGGGRPKFSPLLMMMPKCCSAATQIQQLIIDVDGDL